MAETYQHQILVRLLDGRTHCLRFSTPTVSGATLLDAVSALSRVPAASLRLVTGRLNISPSSVLASSPDCQFPSASALLRLRGGKGGFGSLLRGAASKAGQKKTSNFDACRDINGRRLRHVNAERRLEEWKAEAADRQLEKLAEDFIKKKAKQAGRGGVKAAEVDKYLEKFRKDAESCVNAVEESVRVSLKKRKAVPKPRTGADAKKLKIWLGKKTVEDDDSDSDSDVDGDEDTDAKSIVLDDGNCSNGSNKSEEKVELGSVSVSHSEGESSGEKSQYIVSEEKVELGSVSVSHSEGESSGEKSQYIVSEEKVELGSVSVSHSEGESSGEKSQRSVSEEKVMLGSVFVSHSEGEYSGENSQHSVSEEKVNCVQESIELTIRSGGDFESDSSVERKEETFVQPSSGNGISAPSEEVLKSDGKADVDNTGSATSLLNDPEVPPVEESADGNKSPVLEELLDLTKFNSAAELEALGLEKLKLELQTRGLKCGGTLQERAGRLFLLKTTPLEKLPKKLLAKPSAGGK